ncbi:MAG TPA: F0F1 ATP synthase subunit A [Aestuariivirgaceae bacterium]
MDPIHQFEIEPIIPIHIGGLDLSLTNSGLWALIAVALVSLLMLTAPTRLIPTRLQSVAESLYDLVFGMTEEVLGPQGRSYFPFVFTLFAFILAANLLGLIPGAFTVTSHIIVTLALALVVFIGATAIGFIKHGAGYFRLFVPAGVPQVLLPFVVPIEIISYFIRPFSLSIRLFANMMAGHMMLKVIAGFVIMLGVLAGWLPLMALVAIYALELLVAVLQAYVFALLTCLYLNDALHVDH